MSRPPRKASEFVEEDAAIARLREELKKRFPLPAPKPKTKKRTTGTTLGLVLLALVIGLVWFDPAYRTERHASAVGRQQAIALADGSQVRLDSASSLLVRWHLRSRQVELQAGQALFEVSPMVYRPFLVNAGGAEVKVVGTRFNVSRQTDDVLVTVAEGRVAVRGQAASAPTFLEPGQQLRVHDGQPAGRPRPVDVEDVLAWREHRLVFAGTPLGEVVDIIQRYHAAPVRLVDGDLAGLPISGVFDSGRVDDLIALLPGILPVSVSRDADGAVSIHRRAEKK